MAETSLESMHDFVEMLGRKKKAPQWNRRILGRLFSSYNNIVDIGRKLMKLGRKIVNIGRNSFNNIKII